jgi:hypothetical protein
VNLLNSRRIGKNEYNIFGGIYKNKLMLYFVILAYLAQQAIIYYGGSFFKTSEMSLYLNLFCHLLALGSTVIFWLVKLLASDLKEY